jgi:hypothetical protein
MIHLLTAFGSGAGACLAPFVRTSAARPHEAVTGVRDLFESQTWVEVAQAHDHAERDDGLVRRDEDVFGPAPP